MNYIFVFKENILLIMLSTMHQDVPIILAGNKTDLADVEREIYLEDVRDWLDQDFKQNKYVAASSNQCTSREKKTLELF